MIVISYLLRLTRHTGYYVLLFGTAVFRTGNLIIIGDTYQLFVDTFTTLLGFTLCRVVIAFYEDTFNRSYKPFKIKVPLKINI